MSVFWIIYFVSLGTVLVITSLVFSFYKIKRGYLHPTNEPIPLSHFITMNAIGLVPCANLIVGFVLIILVVFGIMEGTLVPKNGESN